MTCDTSKATPWKNTKKLTFRLAAMEFCTSMLRATHAVPCTHTSLRLQIDTFSIKKVFYFSTKRLCFAECLFYFMQRWINRRKIRFTGYSILIKAKARSNMNTALIRALTNVKLCVSNMSWLYLYLGSLTKKGTNVILALTALLTYTKRGIKYLNGFDMHLIPRSNMTITLTLLLTCLKAFKDTTALDTDLLGKSCSKTSWVWLHFDPSSCHVKGESNMVIAYD